LDIPKGGCVTVDIKKGKSDAKRARGPLVGAPPPTKIVGGG